MVVRWETEVVVEKVEVEKVEEEGVGVGHPEVKEVKVETEVDSVDLGVDMEAVSVEDLVEVVKVVW